MTIDFHPYLNHATGFFKERLEISLTAQQKKILVIAALALSALALIYAVSRCCSKEEVVTEPPVTEPPVIRKKNNLSPPPSPNLTSDYSWVKGAAKAKEFMESEKDLAVITAVANTYALYHWDSRRLRDPDYLYISDLLAYASADQIQAIISTVADDVYKVRAILRTLLENMYDPASDFEVQKQKAKAALQSLSSEQLMNTLSIDIPETNPGRYQMINMELGQIPVKAFLKWNVELELPKEFIKKCRQLSKYAEHVKSEVEKEISEGVMLCD